MSDTTEPTAGEARTLLGLNSTALSNASFGTFLTFTNREVDNTSDTQAILYYTCWLIADQAEWSHVIRMGDQTYSGPNPETWKNRYIKRCQELNVTPKGIGHAGGIRKGNSSLDDHPNNWSVSKTTSEYGGGTLL